MCTYFDIFPDAKLKITPKTNDEFSDELNPHDVGDLVSYLCSGKPQIRYLTIEHNALCKRVFVLIFDGLDNSRFCKYRSELPVFSSISKNGYPLTVLADEKKSLIVPAVQTFLGYAKSKKLKKYSSYEEMLASLNQRYDNGYPIKPGTELPVFTRPCRYTHFKMEPISLEELEEFKELPEEVENSLSVIGIDCEMIKTSKGEEVARLSVVNENCETVIDEYLKPIGEVEDYRTRFSGITQELLTETDDKKLLSSDQCCEVLSRVADKHTIIVGHSLENDLRAMRIIHDRVIDTALIYNHEARYPNKPALSKLFLHYISKNFRVDDSKGHNSVEDARASLMLAKYAMTAEVTEVDAGPTMPTFFRKIIGKDSKSQKQDNQQEQESTENLNQENVENQNHENVENQNQENIENQNQENIENQNHENVENQNQENIENQNHENVENQNQENIENQNQENIENQNQENIENQNHENVENQNQDDEENQNQDDVENQEDSENQNQQKEIPECFKELKKSNAFINVFGPLFHINFSGIDDRVNCYVGSNAEDVINAFLFSLGNVNEIPTLTYAYFHSLSHCELIEEEEIKACQLYNDVLEQTIKKVPPQSAIIIYTANGNLKRLRSNTSRVRPGNDAERLKEYKLCRQGLLWVVCKNGGDEDE